MDIAIKKRDIYSGFFNFIIKNLQTYIINLIYIFLKNF